MKGYVRRIIPRDARPTIETIRGCVGGIRGRLGGCDHPGDVGLGFKRIKKYKLHVEYHRQCNFGLVVPLLSSLIYEWCWGNSWTPRRIMHPRDVGFKRTKRT